MSLSVGLAAGMAISSSGWRPIETAPKDGVKIIGYCQRNPEWGCNVTWWNPVTEWCWPDKDENGEDRAFWYAPVTHWQPLPEPPKG